MRDVHTIRLRGPWQLEPLVRWTPTADGRYELSADPIPAATRAKMPADWSGALGDNFLGQVRYSRSFHEPSGLEDLEEVWLVIEPPRSCATIKLNQQALGEARFSGPCFRIEITNLLQDTNQLELTVIHPELDAAGRPVDDGQLSHPGGLVGEVRLEIGFPD